MYMTWDMMHKIDWIKCASYKPELWLVEIGRKCKNAHIMQDTNFSLRKEEGKLLNVEIVCNTYLPMKSSFDLWSLSHTVISSSWFWSSYRCKSNCSSHVGDKLLYTTLLLYFSLPNLQNTAFRAKNSAPISSDIYAALIWWARFASHVPDGDVNKLALARCLKGAS